MVGDDNRGPGVPGWQARGGGGGKTEPIRSKTVGIVRACRFVECKRRRTDKKGVERSTLFCSRESLVGFGSVVTRVVDRSRTAVG